MNGNGENPNNLDAEAMVREGEPATGAVPHETLAASIPIEPTEPPRIAPQSSDSPPAPYGLKKDGTPKKRHTGGKNGGCPKGVEKVSKKKFDPALMAEIVAEKVVTGKAVAKIAKAAPLTVEAKALLARVSQESVEVFNERIANNLRAIADLASQRIQEKLENDEFKTSELGFILSVAHDKRLSLDGSRALQQASVNITINASGPTPKDQLLAELDGLAHTKNVTPKKESPPS